MTAKGISIEMPIGADAPTLADGVTPNPFFAYISQAANRAGYRGVEVIDGKLWLRKITDLDQTSGFRLSLLAQIITQAEALFGGPIEIHNYPTALKVAKANADGELPEYVTDFADVVVTPAVPEELDPETGEVVTPAVEAVTRRVRYSDLTLAGESETHYFYIAANGRRYVPGTEAVQLQGETGVSVVPLSAIPVPSEPSE